LTGSPSSSSSVAGHRPLGWAKPVASGLFLSWRNYRRPAKFIGGFSPGPGGYQRIDTGTVSARPNGWCASRV